VSTLQTIRGRIEDVTAAALQAAGVAPTFDNVQEDPPPLPWASITVSFGGSIATSLGCVADQVAGTVTVQIHSRKRLGSRQGEDAAFAVLQAWGGLNRERGGAVRVRTTGHQGPLTVAPGADAEHRHRLSCSFSARLPVEAAA
jgi:hypothetical protein